MTALNQLYGAALAMPSQISGILISDAPAPHEGANGLYVLGTELNGNPTYYFEDYLIANVGFGYALYHTDNVSALINEHTTYYGGLEIWMLGEEANGPVGSGLMGEPYPTLQGVSVDGAILPSALLHGESPVNPLEAYPSATVLPGYPTNAVSLPVAVGLPTSPENLVSNPVANNLPASSIHPVNSFGSALQPPGFPAYLIRPPSPSFSVRSGSSTLQIKVQTASGGRFCILNQSNWTSTEFADSASTLGIELLPNQWNLISIQAENGQPTDIRNLDINTINYIVADFILNP